MVSGQEPVKSDGHTSEEPAARRWKSGEAAEAAAGQRPGLPGMWDSWASLPAGQRTETAEIEPGECVLVQDCEVCCQPWTVRVQMDPNGAITVSVERD